MSKIPRASFPSSEQQGEPAHRHSWELVLQPQEGSVALPLMQVDYYSVMVPREAQYPPDQ